MQRASKLFALAALAGTLAACSAGGSDSLGLIPQSRARHSADTLGGGPVFSGVPTKPAQTPNPALVQPKDTLGGGPVFSGVPNPPAQTPEPVREKRGDTLGGGPVFSGVPGS